MSVAPTAVYVKALTGRLGIGVTLNPDGSVASVTGVEILRTEVDPNGVHAANAGSLALMTNGTLWSNTDGATAWTEVGGGGGGGWTPTYGTGYMAIIADILNDTLVLKPNGTGALSTGIPDSTATGGNPRGEGSVDLQLDRVAATQVAAGWAGTISGGGYNTIDPDDFGSVIAGGYENTIGPGSQQSAISGGQNNIIDDSVCSVIGGGEQNEIHEDDGTICGGVLNTIFADAFGATISGGEANEARANADYCWIGGVNTIVDHYGEFAYGHGNGQWGKIPFQGFTTNATPKVMSLNGSTDSATNRFTIAIGATYKFRIEALSVQYGGSSGAVYDTKWFEISGIIRNKAGVVEFLGALTATSGGDAAATNWTLVATANDTGDCLTLTFTGELNKSVRTYATAHYTKLQIL